MSTFWERKKAEYSQQHQPYTGPVNPSDQPWWARGTSLVSQPAPQDQQAQDGSQGVTGQPMYQPAIGYPQQANAPKPNEPGYVAYRLSQPAGDGDFQRAVGIRSGDWCPNCGSGNYMQPPDSSRAKHCFNCGHVEGRSVHDMNMPMSAVTDTGQGRMARQLSQHGFQGNIRSGNEAAQSNVMLEMSAMGRSSV